MLLLEINGRHAHIRQISRMKKIDYCIMNQAYRCLVPSLNN